MKKWNSPLCEEYGARGSGIFQEGDR